MTKSKDYILQRSMQKFNFKYTINDKLKLGEQYEQFKNIFKSPDLNIDELLNDNYFYCEIMEIDMNNFKNNSLNYLPMGLMYFDSNNDHSHYLSIDFIYMYEKDIIILIIMGKKLYDLLKPSIIIINESSKEKENDLIFTPGYIHTYNVLEMSYEELKLIQITTI